MNAQPIGYHKQVLSTVSPEGIGVEALSYIASSPSSSTWPSANQGIYVPLRLDYYYRVLQVWWLNGASVAGNVDCGIYSRNGTLLASATPQGQSGTNSIQTFTLGTAILLDPGSYYLALSCSSGSATVRTAPLTASANNAKVLGLAQQASVGTLPATFSLSTYTSTFVPIFGISNSGVL